MTSHRKHAVTSPQTRIARSRRRYRRPWRPATLDPIEAPRAVELYRHHSRTAVLTLVQLGMLVFGLPLFLAALPSLIEITVAGIPVSWLAPVVVPFPTMVVLAFWHLHRVEKTENEQDITAESEALPPNDPGARIAVRETRDSSDHPVRRHPSRRR